MMLEIPQDLDEVDLDLRESNSRPVSMLGVREGNLLHDFHLWRMDLREQPRKEYR